MKKNVTMVFILVLTIVFLSTLLYIGTSLGHHNISPSYHESVLTVEKPSQLRGGKLSAENNLFLSSSSDEGKHEVLPNISITSSAFVDSPRVENITSTINDGSGADNLTIVVDSNVRNDTIAAAATIKLLDSGFTVSSTHSSSILPTVQPTLSPTASFPIDMMFVSSSSFEIGIDEHVYSTSNNCISINTNTQPFADDVHEVGQPLNGNDIVMLVRTALVEGEIFNETSLMDSLKSITDVIARHLVVENLTMFMELSAYSSPSASIAHAIAVAYPDVVSMYIQSVTKSNEGEIIVDIQEQVPCENIDAQSLVIKPDPANYYLLQNHAALLPDFSKKYSNSLEIESTIQQFNCVQYVDDLSEFVHKLLPFEYEEYMQQVFCRCKYTYIPSDLPYASNGVGYFSHWESPIRLIERINNIKSSASCKLELNAESDSNKYLHHVRESYVVIQRVDSAGVLDGIPVGYLMKAQPLIPHMTRLMSKMLNVVSTDISNDILVQLIAKIGNVMFNKLDSSESVASKTNATAIGISWLNAFLLNGNNSVTALVGVSDGLWTRVDSGSSSEKAGDIAVSSPIVSPPSRYAYLWSHSRNLMSYVLGSTSGTTESSSATSSSANRLTIPFMVWKVR